MIGPCRWCGVEACHDRFDECLALDFSDARYGAVHHLSAHAYALQHRTYADEFEGVVARFVLDHLDEPPGPASTAAVQQAASGAIRVARREPGPTPEEPWAVTVADIDPSSPEAYRSTVRAWAEAVASRFVET